MIIQAGKRLREEGEICWAVVTEATDCLAFINAHTMEDLPRATTSEFSLMDKSRLNLIAEIAVGVARKEERPLS